ncbi:endonuclease [Micromonospora andamanensis]|nr:endonuclease [Micromonospora andamanensis]
MPTMVSTIEDRKRLARRLAGSGRGFAEQYGFRVTNNPSSLFQVLCLAVLLARPGDFRRALDGGHALREAGWDSAARLAGSSPADRVDVLRVSGQRGDLDALADLLGELARTVVDRYRGDLRRLRSAAHRDPARERALLTALPGVDEQVADLFLREAQALWREVAPVADRRALTAARRLGLGRSAEDLAGLSGGRASERLAWLVGALARVDLEGRYAELAR